MRTSPDARRTNGRSWAPLPMWGRPGRGRLRRRGRPALGGGSRDLGQTALENQIHRPRDGDARDTRALVGPSVARQPLLFGPAHLREILDRRLLQARLRRQPPLVGLRQRRRRRIAARRGGAESREHAPDDEVQQDHDDNQTAGEGPDDAQIELAIDAAVIDAATIAVAARAAGWTMRLSHRAPPRGTDRGSAGAAAAPA